MEVEDLQGQQLARGWGWDALEGLRCTASLTKGRSHGGRHAEVEGEAFGETFAPRAEGPDAWARPTGNGAEWVGGSTRLLWGVTVGLEGALAGALIELVPPLLISRRTALAAVRA
mmetsp:Transcript_15086/g.30270  ORF Transcript_15086/g.30270 Transcript_15086/m.30270 type:complete len:115 (+) Transcript_15086:67-411(+)